MQTSRGPLLLPGSAPGGCAAARFGFLTAGVDPAVDTPRAAAKRDQPK